MISPEIASLIEPLSASLSQVEEILGRECRSSNHDFINKAAARIALDHGKRLRPILVLAVANAFSGVTPAHIYFSSVIELIHTATLLHDDVLDGAQRRRHRRTVNSEWGNTTSVLLGDYIFARALMLLSRLESLELFHLVFETTRDVCEGELLQVSTSHQVGLTQAAYYETIMKKTASLFGACCCGSASLSGASPQTVGVLKQYGLLIGQAFQITDDILDLAGDARIEGKTLGTDLRKGKMTLPLIHLYQESDDGDRELLEGIVSGESIQAAPETIHRLLSQGRGLTKTIRAVEELCSRAVAIISPPELSFDRRLFLAIPEFLIAQSRGYLTHAAEPAN